MRFLQRIKPIQDEEVLNRLLITMVWGRDALSDEFLTFNGDEKMDLKYR